MHVVAAMSVTFTLNPAIDATALARTYREQGRVRIGNFLAGDGAQQLRDALAARQDWKQVMNSGERVVELDRPTRAQLTPEQLSQLDDAVHAGARSGFQYRYEAVRVPDDDAQRAASDDIVAAFARFLSAGPARELLRSIVGEEAIAFADAQATAYAPGDFLTGHDDKVAGKKRFAAYVLGLNPVWRIEWGGLLLMHKNDHDVAGVSPGFNTLDLFGIGQMHSVSQVTRAAAWRRYAITGWLRAR